jgi:hypothetical protein
MTTIDDIIGNPLLREMHARQRAAVLDQFPMLSSCSHEFFLVLLNYINKMPQQLYTRSIYMEYLRWLDDRDSKTRLRLQNYLSEQVSSINHALLNLAEINGFSWHDSYSEMDDYGIIQFIDQRVHPTYLRLVEAVFYPFLRLIAYFSRLDRGAGTDGLDVWCTVQEIKDNCFREALQPYHHIIRNGIGHGGIKFLQNAIVYRDKNGNEEKYEDMDIIRIFDDLLDVCNALALALSIFLFIHQSDGYVLPRQLLIEELKAETESPWWKIVGCTPSEFSGIKQLIVYARPKTMDYGKVQISAFQSGILAERFAPDFDRYFFSIRGERSLPGWAAFDGNKLRMLREKKSSALEEYRDVIENNLVFYVPRFSIPKLLGRIETLYIAFRIYMGQAVTDVNKQIGRINVFVRNAKIHRNSWGCVVNGSVYVEPVTGEIDQDSIRVSCRRIVNMALSHARQRASFVDTVRYLPVGFARISIFQKNYRKRRLSNFGLGKDLICTIQVQRLKRIQSPDIYGATIEEYGRYRIAWNRAWIEDFQRLAK